MNVQDLLQNQVLNIEQMNHLVELGVDTSDASMCWAGKDVVPNDGAALDLGQEGIPTFSLDDLYRKLPSSIDFGLYRHSLIINKGEGYVGYKAWYKDIVINSLIEFSITDSVLDSLYRLYCWFLLNENSFKKVRW